ncbi:MAG: dockerin type I domain-containing protein [Planctomycetota bacterium]
MQGRETNRSGLVTRSALSMAALVMALATTSATYATEERAQINRGDLDRDGQITEADLMLFTEYHYGVTPARSLETLDVNDDGRIDAEDYDHMHKIVYFYPRTAPKQAEVSFSRGDTNNDGHKDLRDVMTLISVIQGGAMAAPMDAADVHRDGFIDEQDVQLLLKQLFVGKVDEGEGE